MLLCLLLLNSGCDCQELGLRFWFGVWVWLWSKGVFFLLLLLLFYFLFFYDGFGDLVRKLVEVFAGWENKRSKKLKVVCLSRKWKKMGEKKKILDHCWVQPAMTVKRTERSATPKLRSVARNWTLVLPPFNWDPLSSGECLNLVSWASFLYTCFSHDWLTWV